MGINAAMKNANMLLKDVKNTLTPVVPRQYAAGPWNTRKATIGFGSTCN